MKKLTEIDLSKKEIRKHVAAIQINGKLSFLQRKLANVLLWNAYDELKKSEKHRIRIRDLAFWSGFDSNDVQVLKDALKGLAETPLEWNILHEDGDEEWGVASMIGQAVIRGGYCFYSYSPDLRDKFHNPEMYARINMGIQRNITTGYALTLYENCIRYRKVGSTGWINVEDARKLFGVDDKEYYKTFKFFNNKIIKPAVNGVNKASDILTSVQYRRHGRFIGSIRFIIKENPQLSLFKTQKVDDESANQLPPPAIEQPKKREKKALRDRLISYGVNETRADRYLDECSDEYISGNLDIVEKNFEAGKVVNLPAYTLSALEKDYRPKTSPYELAQAEKKSARKEALAEQARKREQEEQAQHQREADELRRRIESLSETERQAFETRFRKAHEHHALFLKWQHEGLHHPIIRGFFLAFARRELVEGESDESIIVEAA